MHKFFGKGWIFPLFLLFVASCAPICRQWQIETADVVCPNYPIAKLYLPPQDSPNSLEVEFARYGSDVRMYLNVFSVPFPYDAFEPSSVEISVIIDDEAFTSQAECLKGGQRLLVAPETANQVIDALVNCQTVSIKAGRYSTTLIDYNFADLFESVCR